MVIFTYSFPHKKSQDFIIYTYILGYKIDAVVATQPKQLKKPLRKHRYKPIHEGLLDIRFLCSRLNIEYHEFEDHNSEECISFLRSLEPDLGLIGGSRILKSEVIEIFKKGIVNFHPGLIPEVRGMDSMLWAIYYGKPLGVTAHFIDKRVDAGRVILKRKISVQPDDTFLDLSLRLYETQLSMLPEVLALVHTKRPEDFPPVPKGSGKPNSYFPPEKENELQEKFEILKRTLRRSDSYGSIT